MSACMGMETQMFRQLIEQHQRMVFSIALRVTGEYGVAEEVAQDVFLELYRGGDALNGADHTKFWLRRVTVNKATDSLRRKRHRPEAAAEEWSEEQHATGAEAGSNPSLDVGIAARLEELLMTLPEPMRVAVVLRHQEEMRPDEIAQLLSQPVATVKSNLQRGLHLLRRKAAVTMKEYVR
jgi:RNA polymerase sigma-70 factor (ECF subfamily)